jgi:hypothetical protein
MLVEPELASLPSRLLRFYRSEDRKYADALVVDGRVRLSRLTTYQRLEDVSRSDPDEGEGRLRVPGDVPVVHLSLIDGGFTDGGTVPGHFNFSTSWVQPLYVFCSSLPHVSLDLGRARFGPELVEIHDPARFAAELARSVALLNLEEREILWVEGFPVSYDKDAVSALPLDRSERSRFPHTPAYTQQEALDHLCGFGMKFFDGVAEVIDTGFDINTDQYKDVVGRKFTDKNAIEFVYSTFQLLDQLHKSRIVLGDVNPRNLLVRMPAGTPVIVDLDSAQVGLFKCPGYSPEYIDPLVQAQGQNASGGYSYSIGADVFSMACVLFEFIVGVHPFNIRVRPALNIESKKLQGVSYFHVIDPGRAWPAGVAHMPGPLDTRVARRLSTLAALDAKLVAFFREVIAEGGRANLIEALDRTDPRHPAFIFYSTSGFGTVLADILRARKAAVAVVRIPDPGFGRVLTTLTTRAPAAVTLPDSGFAAVMTPQPIAVVDVVPAAAPAALEVTTTPDVALMLFASQYALDLTEFV